MDIQALRWFVVLCETENTRDAAAEVGTGQSAMSRALSRLEADLGVPLFHRFGRRLQLNRFGELYLGPRPPRPAGTRCRAASAGCPRRPGHRPGAAGLPALHRAMARAGADRWLSGGRAGQQFRAPPGLLPRPLSRARCRHDRRRHRDAAAGGSVLGVGQPARRTPVPGAPGEPSTRPPIRGQAHRSRRRAVHRVLAVHGPARGDRRPAGRGRRHARGGAGDGGDRHHARTDRRRARGRRDADAARPRAQRTRLSADASGPGTPPRPGLEPARVGGRLGGGVRRAPHGWPPRGTRRATAAAGR